MRAHHRRNLEKLWIPCKFCGEIFPTTTHAEAHEEQVHQSAISLPIGYERPQSKKCLICPEEFDFNADDEEIREHIREEHPNHVRKNWVFCSVCSHFANSDDALDDHFVNAHGDRFAYACGLCDDLFPDRFHTLNHRKDCSKNDSLIFDMDNGDHMFNIIDKETGERAYTVQARKNKFSPLYEVSR